MSIIITIIVIIICLPVVLFLGVLIYENKKIANKIEKEERWLQ